MGEAYVHPTGVVDWSYKVKMYDIRSQAGIFDLAVAIHQSNMVPMLASS